MGWDSFEGRAPKVGALGGNYSLPDIGRFNVAGYAMLTRPTRLGVHISIIKTPINAQYPIQSGIKNPR